MVSADKQAGIGTSNYKNRITITDLPLQHKVTIRWRYLAPMLAGRVPTRSGHTLWRGASNFRYVLWLHIVITRSYITVKFHAARLGEADFASDCKLESMR